MEKRHRVGALVIREKKLLMVIDNEKGFFTHPGGKLEEGESHHEALVRELDEELAVTVTSKDQYLSYPLVNQITGDTQLNYDYLVTIDGEPSCSDDVCQVTWVTKQQITDGEVKVYQAFQEHLFPRLVQDGLI